ncbi:helicase [Arthrobacter sp. AK-YN10]|nr:helicase [Arthrobacter sp. AK-YN10]GLU59315.1 helicase [Paenarthrobacter ureafaciens]GLU63583.1 helicase [Paenarthrobacter ureafaciens]GLU67757.1 helicase [Paenarthrobacter ureafaciens]GLU72118.1 helicase [Paenarthrobacter ureafaciens]
MPDLDAVVSDVDPEDSPEVLSRFIAEAVKDALSATKPEERVTLANMLLTQLRPDNQVTPGPRQLLSLHRPDALRRRQLRRPATKLSESALLTNGKDDPNLAAEIRTEIESANTVDLLCAFVRWTGLRLLEPALEQLNERGVSFRVITTTYMGATERRAIDELVRRYGAEVKISYETQATRLHAKAWLFRRRTGFDTAYVGSSNLSQAALLDGLEWNVRLSSIATPELLRKFEVTFDSYWEQKTFQSYDPDRDGERLDAALERNGGRRTAAPDTVTGLEVVPFLHQEEMLEDLEAERSKGFSRNLLVAATGTGKTVIAALDYKRLCEAAGRPMSLLFVAHRQEILKQSLGTYRNVMQDGAFGELYVGDHKPRQWTHVFASVQSLASLGVQGFSTEQFDVVVIDEFHHALAPTYRQLLDYLQPQQLLGLTATPERGDGGNVAKEFFEGRTASELRLWDALDADLLVPFHYFGVSDDVDLSRLEWKRGNYDTAQLDRLYTGNDARAAKVIRELRDKVVGTEHMRALGFCVSVQHAHYMARVFNDAGITSVAVDGGTDEAARADALARLRNREVNCIFAVDIFNEGLDIPEVDTILMLRPTQSATIFLQQLGRGLRRADDKAVLTVLDFIGQQRREFRFDLRYRALTGYGRKQLEKAVEEEFPYLPSGSQIVLDRVAQKVVLDNIKAQLRFNRKQLIYDVASYGETVLASYLRESGNDVKTIYRSTRDSWTDYLRQAQLIDGFSPLESVLKGIHHDRSSAEEKKLLGRMAALIHVDDPGRAEAYSMLVSADAPRYAELGTREQSFARMLFYTLWDDGGGFKTYDDGLDHLRAYGFVCSEIKQIVSLGVAASKHAAKGLGAGLQHIPLLTHATYRREEVLAALQFGSLELGKNVQHREGVAWCPATATDAFFVTLNKDDRKHSATTMYKDYAISPELFHWESQNATSSTSPTGKRYLDRRAHGSHIVLFTRDTAEDESGLTVPYTCLGQMDYLQHSGEKPIGITWKLHRPMPVDVYTKAAAVAR